MGSKTESELRESIRIEKVTSSYSIEGRSPKGIKTSSFLSYTATCSQPRGWTMEEARFVESTLAHQVAEDLYTDAFLRQQITKETRQEALKKLQPMYERLQASRLDAATEES